MDSREPHDSQVRKYNLFSLPSSVSGDLQILHVTYSTSSRSACGSVQNLEYDSPMYFLNTFSICF